MQTFNRQFCSHPDSRPKLVQTSAYNVNCSMIVMQEVVNVQ